MSDDVQVTVDQGVLVATINRPTKKNALTREMYASLAASVSRADEDADIGALLLVGSGGNFTSGNDIGLFVEGAEGEQRESPASPFIRNVAALRKPMGDRAREEALSVARSLAAKPRQALMATRGLIRETSDEQVRARLAKESAVLDELRRSDEAQAIFRRFLGRSTRS